MAWNCFCLLNTPFEAPISPAISATNNKPTTRGEHRVVEQTAKLIHWTEKGHDKNIYTKVPMEEKALWKQTSLSPNEMQA